MKKNTLAWVVIAGVGIAFSGMGMAACSSSSATGTPTEPAVDSGGTGNDGSKPPGDDSGPPPSDAGSGPECSSIPTVHPTTGPDGGGSVIFCLTKGLDCAEDTEHCCIPSAGTSGDPSCVASGTACPTQNIDIQCDDSSQCGGATPTCCVNGTPGASTVSGCPSYTKIFGFTGTTCKATCDGLAEDGGVGVEACSTSHGCTSGTQTCNPAKEYVQLGICQ